MQKRADKTAPLLEIMKELVPNASATSIRDWLQKGRITVNNEIIKKTNCIVHVNDIVIFHDHPQIKQPLKDGPLEILFEDSHIAVVHKPAKLLSVSTPMEREQTAHAFLKKRYFPKKVFVIHRLDFDTSGVMVFALSQKAFSTLKEELKERKVIRTYLAVVHGVLKGKGIWQSYLYEDKSLKIQVTDNEKKGEYAETHYEAIKTNGTYTFVRFILKTGKKNQIRVQSANAGYPLVGDKKYGGSIQPAERLLLHAHKLAFTHPITKETLEFEIPPPDIFKILTQ